MNIFKSLLSKIIGTQPAQAATQQPVAAPGESATIESATIESATVALQQPTDVVQAAGGQVDVAKILGEMADKSATKLNWRESIVDLMKLVGIDSSLAARKELAAELGYTGDTSDSAAMNIWLHKQVMKKLAENGGVVPAELL
ncbi:MAG: DUF3597 domain-containing protein [Pseudomonadota bacterium]|jgi:hypothetical protein